MARRRSHARPINAETRLPEEFLDRMRELLGSETDALVDALHGEAPTSIRLNPARSLDSAGERVPWCTNGRYLAERPAFTLDPLFHAGAYYVQEASSMLLEQAVRAAGVEGRELLALDLCAAPGGKTTHLLSLLSPGSFLIANEVDGKRRSILTENCWKSGYPNAAIAGSATSDLRELPETFDLIILDAPCSGEGLFRKDSFARQQWSPRLVEQCSTTQSGIVEDAWLALAPGGHIVYSTCTWETMEDERQVERFIEMGAEHIALSIDPAWGVVRSEHTPGWGYRCYPHRVRGEGFFLSLLRKPGKAPTRAKSAITTSNAKRPGWLRDDEEWRIIESQEMLFAQPVAWSKELERIALVMHLTMPGVPVAERKGVDWVPHAAAAFSALLDTSAVNMIELPLKQAQAYLRGESIPRSNASGSALVTYQGHALGWVQGAGNRWNNRWPAPWRVRQTSSDAPPVPWSRP